MPDIVLFDMPAEYGGARREAADTVLLWRKLGIGVIIVPCREEPADNPWPQRLAAAGCTILPLCVADAPGEFLRGRIVVDFQCRRAVEQWPAMKAAGCKLVHVPCMCHHMPHEVEVFPTCPPTAVVFQSRFQHSQIGPDYLHWAIQAGDAYSCQLIHGAFDFAAFPFAPCPRKPGGPFIVGSIGRDVPAKWPTHLLTILTEARKNNPSLVASWLGWTPAMQSYSGEPPDWVRCYRPGSMTSREFLAGCHCLLVAPDCLENWSRVVLEAMASGVPVVAAKRGGLCEQIKAGTGILCELESQFVEAFDILAANPNNGDYYAMRARFDLVGRLADSYEIGRKWKDLFAEIERL